MDPASYYILGAVYMGKPYIVDRDLAYIVDRDLHPLHSGAEGVVHSGDTCKATHKYGISTTTSV